MTQFMKNYAYKFTQMVNTCKQAAERMAPLWRGEKAAAATSAAELSTRSKKAGWHTQYLLTGTSRAEDIEC